jgi:dimethylamine/trimethylamine dehydrogenase
VVVFDDDHFYLGGVLAELLVTRGHSVQLVTPAPLVSSWTSHTLELGAIQRRVRTAGIVVEANRVVTSVGAGEARLACVFTGAETTVAADTVVLVTARLPLDHLYTALEDRRADWQEHGVRSVRCAGDAWAPSTIAAAVWAGRRYAEEFDLEAAALDATSVRREYTALAPRVVGR